MFHFNLQKAAKRRHFKFIDKNKGLLSVVQIQGDDMEPLIFFWLIAKYSHVMDISIIRHEL